MGPGTWHYTGTPGYRGDDSFISNAGDDWFLLERRGMGGGGEGIWCTSSKNTNLYYQVRWIIGQVFRGEGGGEQ